MSTTLGARPSASDPVVTPGVLWSAWPEDDCDSDPRFDPMAKKVTEWFVGRWPVGSDEPECRILIGEGRSAEIVARRIAEKLTRVLSADAIKAAALAPPAAVPDEVRRLSAVATQGPWSAEPQVDDMGADTGNWWLVMAGQPMGYEFDRPEDAQVAAAAVNYVRDLIATAPPSGRAGDRYRLDFENLMDGGTTPLASAGAVKEALAEFQRRNGYHKPVIEELLTEFGELLLAKASTAPVAPEPAAVGQREAWMQTYRLPRFTVLNPRPDDILIEDLAHHLAQAVRYGGAGIRWLSVAEHSVRLAWAAKPEHKLWALLHDAPEAYLHDIVRPVKHTLAGYLEAEDRLMRAICLRFGLPLERPREVKSLDNRICIDERTQNLPPSDVVWTYGGETEPLGVTLEYWTPERAEHEFLALFAELTGETVTDPRTTSATGPQPAGGDGWIKGPPPSEPDYYGHLPDAADDGLGWAVSIDDDVVLWMLWWEATETGSRIAWHRKPITGPEPTPAVAGAEGGQR